MDDIKILKNCISPEDAQVIIDYINKHQDSFTTGTKKLRFTKMFGKDNHNKEKSAMILDGIDDIQDQIQKVINLSVSSIRDEFQETEDLYLASLWLAKQIPGAQVHGHIDTENGANNHYAYSVLLYLNTTSKSGPLEFPLLNLKIMPSLGDLVIFKSTDINSFHEVKVINEDRYSIPMWFTKDNNYELKQLTKTTSI